MPDRVRLAALPAGLLAAAGCRTLPPTPDGPASYPRPVAAAALEEEGEGGGFLGDLASDLLSDAISDLVRAAFGESSNERKERKAREREEKCEAERREAERAARRAAAAAER